MEDNTDKLSKIELIEMGFSIKHIENALRLSSNREEVVEL
jgi:hypothetical protein